MIIQQNYQQQHYRNPNEGIYTHVTPGISSFRPRSYSPGGCQHLKSVLEIIRQVPIQTNPQILKKHLIIIRTDEGVHLGCSLCYRSLMLFVDEYRNIFKGSPLLAAAQREALKDIDSKS